MNFREIFEAGQCPDNRGCNACRNCMCALAEDAIEEIERLTAERDQFMEQAALRYNRDADMQEIMRINNELLAERDRLLRENEILKAADYDALKAPIERLTAERDRLRAALENIIAQRHDYVHHESKWSRMVQTARAALAERTQE